MVHFRAPLPVPSHVSHVQYPPNGRWTQFRCVRVEGAGTLLGPKTSSIVKEIRGNAVAPMQPKTDGLNKLQRSVLHLAM